MWKRTSPPCRPSSIWRSTSRLPARSASTCRRCLSAGHRAGASLIHARLRSAIDGLDEGEFAEIWRPINSALTMLVRPSGRCHHLPVNHVYRATHLRTGCSRAKPAAKAVAASHYAYNPAGVLALVGCPLDLARTDQAPVVTDITATSPKATSLIASGR